MTYLFHAIASVALLAGCASTPVSAVETSSAPPPAAPAKDQPMTTSVTLQAERTATIAPNTTLRYDGVADSRCPPGMKCVWAGELAYKFTLTTSAGNEMFGLTADKPAFDLTSLPGTRITLGQSITPPVAAAGTVVTALPVTLTISRK